MADDLADRLRAGDRAALARALRILEDRTPGCSALLAAVAPHIGGAHRVGITGPPGVGKSTLVAALVGEARKRGRRVGVLAVDPSSPRCGGALLGDRIRMADHFLDADVFVRSMASRGELGGLSASAGHALDVLDAAGFDLLFLETAGAGQTDCEVVGEVESTVVVLAPGLGDTVQAMKSGLMEIADIWAVNKGDDPRAEQVRAEILAAHALCEGAREDESRVLVVSATGGEGVPALLDALDGLRDDPECAARRASARRSRCLSRLRAAVREQVESTLSEGDPQTERLIDRILEGKGTIQEAASELIRRGLGSPGPAGDVDR